MRNLLYGIGDLSSVGVAFIAIVPLIALGLVYVLGDLDGRRTGRRDPALGVKVATTLLITISFQIALLGLAGLVTALVADAGKYANQMAAGVLLGGLLAGALPLTIYLSRLRDVGGSGVGRKALGVNAIVCGLTFTALTVGIAMVLVNGESVKLIVGGWLIYGAATAVMLGKLSVVPAPEQA